MIQRTSLERHLIQPSTKWFLLYSVCFVLEYGELIALVKQLKKETPWFVLRMEYPKGLLGQLLGELRLEIQTILYVQASIF